VNEQFYLVCIISYVLIFRFSSLCARSVGPPRKMGKILYSIFVFIGFICKLIFFSISLSNVPGQAGIRSRFAALTILVPPEPPKINQGDFMVTTEDREIELECISVGGKPAAEVSHSWNMQFLHTERNQFSQTMYKYTKWKKRKRIYTKFKRKSFWLQIGLGKIVFDSIKSEYEKKKQK
jgi:hypothetical protein